MIDPMADIDNPNAAMSAGGGGSGDNDGDGDHSQEVFDMNAYRANFIKMDKIRSFMGIASGCVAGVCGLTGLSGLGKFCVFYMHLAKKCVYAIIIYFASPILQIILLTLIYLFFYFSHISSMLPCIAHCCESFPSGRKDEI